MVGIPNVFANQTNPTMDELDENFQFVAALGIGPCIASGTNAIALAPAAAAVVIAAYQDYGMFAFRVAVTSTGAVTINYNGLGALPAILPSGVQVGSGNFVAGDFVIVARDSVAGCFHVVSAPVTGAPSRLLDLIGATQGDVLYRGASGWAALAPGTSGQFLETLGPGANPQWISPGSTGAGGYSPRVIAVSGSVDLGALFPTATSTTAFRITVVSGGGGGGGVDTTNGAKAGGGASGQWGIAVYTGIAGLVLTLTIGTGGTAGANTGGNGGAGGATTLTYSSGGNSLNMSTQTAAGGTGSTSATGYSPGGGNSNTAVTITAGGTIILASTPLCSQGQQNGGNGLCGTGTTGISGNGGSTPWGAGGAGATGAGANAGHGYGAGGGGASDSAGAGALGGVGTSGILMIEAWGL